MMVDKNVKSIYKKMSRKLLMCHTVFLLFKALLNFLALKAFERREPDMKEKIGKFITT